jgi:hypothetical protein
MVHLDHTIPVELAPVLPLTTPSTQEKINKILRKKMAISVTQIKHEAGKRKRNAFDTNLSQKNKYHVISGFRRGVEEICALLVYYVALDFLTLQDETYSLPRNYGKELPIYGA